MKRFHIFMVLCMACVLALLTHTAAFAQTSEEREPNATDSTTTAQIASVEDDDGEAAADEPELEQEDATSESAIANENETVVFTPDGTSTVVDTADSADGKQFYTITTPAGNVFYLIIDLERESDNVYFLDAVNEKDLLALAEQSNENEANDSISAIPDTNTSNHKPDEIESEKSTKSAHEDSEEEMKAESSSGSKGVILIIIMILAAGGAGYYFKIYRPKQTGKSDEYDDDENEYEEYEPEPVDSYEGDILGDETEDEISSWNNEENTDEGENV